MGKALFVVGSDTDVGKTFVTAALTYILAKDSKVVPYKPIQSGGEYINGELRSMDIEFVKDICTLKYPNELMNSYCFEDAVSPHIAAERQGTIINFDKIIDHANSLTKNYDYTIIEGAGGVVVPLSRDVYIYDLIKKLNVSVILVTRAGVGTINHTALTIAFLKSMHISIKAIVVNNYTASYYEEDNIKIIKALTGIKEIVTLNHVKAGESIKDVYETCFDSSRIKKWFV